MNCKTCGKPLLNVPDHLAEFIRECADCFGVTPEKPVAVTPSPQPASPVPEELPARGRRGHPIITPRQPGEAETRHCAGQCSPDPLPVEEFTFVKDARYKGGGFRVPRCRRCRVKREGRKRRKERFCVGCGVSFVPDSTLPAASGRRRNCPGCQSLAASRRDARAKEEAACG